MPQLGAGQTITVSPSFHASSSQVMLQFQNLEAQVETSVTGILKVLRSPVVATMLAPFQVLKD